MSTKDGGTDEKRQKAEAIQPKVSDGQDYAVNEMGEGDKILGLTTEYSGWDVYNNEARKVDRELVKDWTASLNFLLLFVSVQFT
jgi:regulatory protein YycI of two-component signal transduction system YycFG